MPKRKTVEQRFAEIVQEMGLIQAEAAFRLIKGFATRPEPKPRRKPVAVEAKAS